MDSIRVEEIREWLDSRREALQEGRLRTLNGQETLEVLAILIDLIDEVERLTAGKGTHAYRKLETVTERGKTLYKCPYPNCDFKGKRVVATLGHVQLRHLHKGEYLDADGNIVEGPPTTIIPKDFLRPSPTPSQPPRVPPAEVMAMKPSEYLEERIVHVCSLDKKPCKNRTGKCATCKKARKKFVDRVVHSKSKKFQDGYQQALDDIRWGRNKNKAFVYHCRPVSQEDRLAEIRAIDKEMKGGGNIDQE